MGIEKSTGAFDDTLTVRSSVIWTDFALFHATVNRWLGGKAPSRGIPGQAILEP